MIPATDPETRFTQVTADPSWPETRNRAEGGYIGYLADLEDVRQWTESEAGWQIGRQIRCALIEAAIHSLAGQLNPAVLRTRLEEGVWNPAIALEHIRHIMGHQVGRGWALTRLTPFLDGDLLDQALDGALALNDDMTRVGVLSALAVDRPTWVQTHAEVLRPQVIELVADLSGSERGAFIDHITELCPVWQPLGDIDTAWAVAQTIKTGCEIDYFPLKASKPAKVYGLGERSSSAHRA